jgi:hypothetical protein
MGHARELVEAELKKARPAGIRAIAGGAEP